MSSTHGCAHEAAKTDALISDLLATTFDVESELAERFEKLIVCLVAATAIELAKLRERRRVLKKFLENSMNF